MIAAAAAAVAVVVAAALFPGGVAATAGDPTVAPPSVRSPDGRMVTAGPLTLAVGQVDGLDPAGQTVEVVGSGYDTAKGVYAALCVVPPPNVAPGPCGGGVDIAGQAGAAQWISSNPPDYGVGLARPYGPGGTFASTFGVRAEIAPGIDCRQLRCAVVTRNDHTRTADRSQDVLVPVTFRAQPAVPAAPSVPGPAAPAPPVLPGGAAAGPPQAAVPVPAPSIPVVDTSVPTTVAPTTAPPRTVTLSVDGRSATDGARTLTVSTVADLDPTAAEVTVDGAGFEPGRGINVSLCRVAADAATPPGPCAGGAGASVWFHSAPPAHGVGVARPFDDGGTFSTTLALPARIDADTDCREVPCAVVVRADVDTAGDRSLDLAVPVSFAAVSATVPPSPTAGPVVAAARRTADANERAGGGGPWAALAAAALVGATAAGGAVVLRRRRAGS